MPASNCISVTPVSSSPARMARTTGLAPRQRGSSEKCTLTKPCAGHRQQVGRQDLAVGHHHGHVGGQRPQPVEVVRRPAPAGSPPGPGPAPPPSPGAAAACPERPRGLVGRGWSPAAPRPGPPGPAATAPPRPGCRRRRPSPALPQPHLLFAHLLEGLLAGPPRAGARGSASPDVVDLVLQHPAQQLLAGVLDLLALEVQARAPGRSRGAAPASSGPAPTGSPRRTTRTPRSPPAPG